MYLSEATSVQCTHVDFVRTSHIVNETLLEKSILKLVMHSVVHNICDGIIDIDVYL